MKSALERTMYRNDLIRAAIVNKDLNKTSFARETGLNPKTVDKLWDGVNVELQTLEKASEFLGIPLQALFEPKESAEATA
jgi:DNA-binding Xre family transcriptional regulator